jgi:hypothetical protein
MLLHIHDIKKAISLEQIEYFKSHFKHYLETHYCIDKSCYDLINDLKCFDKEFYLISPIKLDLISIDDFCEENKINISHNIAVSKNQIIFCKYNQIIMSDYRPGNLFWDFKSANMRQQDDTIDEYWTSIHNSLKLYTAIYG